MTGGSEGPQRGNVSGGPRVAYLLQTHAVPQQIDRLVARLRDTDPLCVVHISHDRTGPQLEASTTGRAGVLTSLDVGGRGRFHNVRRWLDAVTSLQEQPPVDYVVTLTGQDYPVRPAADLHAALLASGDGLVEHFDALDGRHWPRREGRSRYLYRWTDVAPLSPVAVERLHGLHVLNRVQPFVRVNVSYGSLRLALHRRRQPFGPDLRCYGGSFFTNVSWRAAAHVLDVSRRRPDVLAWGEQSLLAEEGYIPSILLSASRFSFANTSGRFYDFSHTRHGSPAVLGVDDVPAALASGAFFARKWGADFERAYDAVDAALDAD